MIVDVKIDRQAQKELRKLPAHIITKLRAWVDAVEHFGLEEVRKVPGFHDKPLRGNRAGQRSIRLSRAYRAIYIIEGKRLKIVVVKEVNKHDY